MNPLEKTAYCGIFCPDCIRYKNEYSDCASQLKSRLMNVEFEKYAKVDTPFGANFNKYDVFMEVLDALSSAQCSNPCRVGGGCSGEQCEIMKCCLSRGFDGCWDCGEVAGCDKFTILAPRCGEMPKNNILKIKKHGMNDWAAFRDNFYIWQE